MSAAVGRVLRRSLPASASSVLSACSCGASVVVRLSSDSKTSPLGVWGSKGATAVYANAIATTAGPRSVGGSCPGFTEACRSCYGKNLERYSAFERMAAENLATLEHVEQCGGARALARVFVDVLDHVREHQERDHLEHQERATFRWNMSGDIWSESVARAIASAHRQRPQVEGWLYTRTLGAVRHLVRGGAGLRVYVSLDEFNLERGARVAARWGVPVALLADDVEHARGLLERVESVVGSSSIPAARVCPASGKWATDGRGPAHVVGLDGRRSSLERGGFVRGACDACRLCLPRGLESSVVFLRRGSTRDLFSSVPVSIGGRA